MSDVMMRVGKLTRVLMDGSDESLEFSAGVNVLVGVPNTGKTKWLNTLDYLLGDNGEQPFEGAEEEGLSEKYQAASVELVIGETQLLVQRNWVKPGAKSKISIDGETMSPKEFQQMILKLLGIPLLSFPKGNPMSGQTWPDLSFRMLLRHIYRQQRFWGGIADLQPEGELTASLLQFLGLAESTFTEEYGKLMALRVQIDRMRARRDQYQESLDMLAVGLLSEPGISVAANPTSIESTHRKLSAEIAAARRERNALLSRTFDQVGAGSEIADLAAARAEVIRELEKEEESRASVLQRLASTRTYLHEMQEELDRMARVQAAGAVLSDLKVTHCPACDQQVSPPSGGPGECFLCHQSVDSVPPVSSMGAVRIQFEHDRIVGETKEAQELVAVLEEELAGSNRKVNYTREKLAGIEARLLPARSAAAALVQEDVSRIDVLLGELAERLRNLARVGAAVEVGRGFNERLAALEKDAEPLKQVVKAQEEAADCDMAASDLEDGINAYLNAINELRPGVWRHSPITVSASRGQVVFRVGSRRWHAALGGTDSLYFLMAYHYGLLALSSKKSRHYPGVTIIDIPGEFAGEAVEDKENFIVEPFVALLSQAEYGGAQAIITGASFAGLHNVKRIELHTAYVS